MLPVFDFCDLPPGASPATQFDMRSRYDDDDEDKGFVDSRHRLC